MQTVRIVEGEGRELQVLVDNQGEVGIGWVYRRGRGDQEERLEGVDAIQRRLRLKQPCKYRVSTFFILSISINFFWEHTLGTQHFFVAL